MNESLIDLSANAPLVSAHCLCCLKVYIGANAMIEEKTNIEHAMLKDWWKM
jgi:hypothetical protein